MGLNTEDRRLALGLLALTAITVTTLVAMGRRLGCACGSAVPWSFDVMSSHNSQHLIDPYTLSHILHGVVFYWAFRLVLGQRWPRGRFAAAMVLEALWEIVENTEMVINRYRESTASLDYHGDSVANSLADIAWCAAGYAAAASISVWASVGMFVVFELVMVVWIRDSLLLNVLMLVWPIEAVKQWQIGG